MNPNYHESSNSADDTASDQLLDERFFVPLLSANEQRDFFRTRVQKVIIESSSYCNRKCHFCPNSLRTEKKTMGAALFSAILDQLEEIDYQNQIILHLYNEPLAFPEQLITSVADIRRRLPKSFIYFSTNGDFLQLDIMNRLADAGLSAMTVSLHPGRQFREERLLNRFFSLACKLNVELRFISFEEQTAIFAETLFRNIPIKIRAVDFTRRGSNRAGLMQNVDAPANRCDPCSLPFEIFTVGYDGTVFPCYNMLAGVDEHKQHAITKLTPECSIFAAFNHPKLRSWCRSTFLNSDKLPPCNSCRLDFVKISPKMNQARKNLLSRIQNGIALDTE